MNNILFLTIRMVSGFGVDLVVANVVRQLAKKNVHVTIACLDMDSSYSDLDIYSIPDRVSSLQRLVDAIQPSVIVAHTYPFFEYIAQLKTEVPFIAWEYGDPTPKLLSDVARVFIERQKAVKSAETYPKCERILAISKFIRKDIGCPQAKVIYLGCDHIPDQGPKSPEGFLAKNRPKIKIGMLNRLGREENRYKGVEAYPVLANLLRQKGAPFEMHFMGRGTEAEAAALREAGFFVHLNATDEEKAKFLREIDIFVTMSLWEGFNLPLAEAQASGTLGLALKTGAHPEVTPFTFKDIRSMASFISHVGKDRKLLARNSLRSYEHVRRTFSWEKAADSFLEVMEDLKIPALPRGGQRISIRLLKLELRIGRFFQWIRAIGLRRILKKIVKISFGTVQAALRRLFR